MKNKERITRRMFIRQIAEHMGVPYKTAREFVTAFQACLADDLRQQCDVVLYGFGKFEMRTRKARRGRNPETGETMQLSATTTPTFHVSKSYKQLITE